MRRLDRLAGRHTAPNTTERNKMKLALATIYLSATIVIPSVLFISIGWTIYAIIEGVLK